MANQFDFKDIAPFDDKEFSAKMKSLVNEPGFKSAVEFVMPGVDYDKFCETLLSIQDKETFQLKVMVPFLEVLVQRTTEGVTMSGFDNINKDTQYTFLSNHRDIVLDASFLNYCLVHGGRNTSEIAIGNNLLIYDWITDLVKLNKSFIVKRNIQRTKALEAAQELSAYIHYAINDKKESVWIAQREGRAKDSNDRTQESLIKMLALAGDENFVDNLKEINIAPLSISYEYDPNDYLKVKEFLSKRRDPDFKKSPHDDLLSMETGILKPKGHIHFHVSSCINEALEQLPKDIAKPETVKMVCAIIDNAIHAGYKIYPINYVAYDKLHNTTEFAGNYTSEQRLQVEEYFAAQLTKVDLPDITPEEQEYMLGMMWAMYANPLRNKLMLTPTE